MSLDRNGDGTVTKDKLRKGMERVGIDLSDNEYSTFLRKIERSGSDQPQMQNDIYYTDLLAHLSQSRGLLRRLVAIGQKGKEQVFRGSI